MEAIKSIYVSLDDIVFADRNKLYGAYLLRRLYNKHVTVAAIIASSLFLFLISMPLVARLLGPEQAIAPVVLPDTKTVVFDIPPPSTVIPPPPPPPQPEIERSSPPPAAATIKYTPPVVKRDDAVTQEQDIPNVEDLTDMVISTKTAEGVKGALPDVGVEGGTGNAPVKDVIPEKPYIFVEQMPSFPGGERALFEFLGKNMKYPRQAINAGIEGQVFVSFVIGRTGEISDIEVLRGIGAGCDEEAVRVIKSMPKWAPGKQNGVTVPVRYNIPVKFSLK